ncbi:MAG: fluoride efflux transporter CrcB [Bacteroidales bacterium]|nr:fluoride efflux transporter CrcB [Bacteroidales bacterium]
MNWILVFVGGGCGCVCRWGLSLALKRYAAVLGGLPVHTLAANLLGCLCIGALMGWLTRHEWPELALLAVTGFCGGFTTFSTFSLETLELFRSGQMGMALLYVALSLLVCVPAVAAGYGLTR